MHDNIERIKKLLFGTTDPKFNFIKEAKQYMAAFPLIAQALVDESGKKIQLKSYRGGLGATDGKTIFIMNTPMPQDKSDIKSFLLFMALKMGLIHHEIGHINHTDFTTKRTRDPFQSHLEGIIEDIRQELLHMAKFHNARKYLDALELAMMEMGLTALPSADDDIPSIQVFTSWFYYKLRYEVSHQLYFKPYLDAIEPKFEETFGLGIRPELELHIAKVVSLKSTQEASDLAEDIRALVVQELKAQQKKQRQQQRKQQNQQSQPSQGSSSQPSPDGDQDDSADPQDQGNPDQGQSQPGQNQADDSSGSGPKQNTAQDDQNDPGQPQGQGSDDQQSQDQQDPLSQTLQNLSDMLKGDGADQAIGDKDDMVRQALQSLAEQLLNDGAENFVEDFESMNATDVTPQTGELHTEKQPSVADAVGVVSRLSSQLRKQLQAQSMDKTARGTRGNKIDAKALLRVPMGDARIFKRINRAQKLETAVCIMADISGSMGGKKIKLANQAIYATACAIERLPDCKVAVGTFPFRQVVLPFGMRASKNINRFMLSVGGSTPMDEGVTMGFRMLQKRKESRKVMFVVTDGEPDNMAQTKNALLASRLLGIEVYAIGIETMSVKCVFENWSVIQNINELPKVVFDMLNGKEFISAA